MNQQPSWQPQQPPNNQQPWDQYPQPYQQTFYNQPTQGNPGQFQQSFNINIPPSKKPGIRTWYASRTTKSKISLVCGVIFMLLLFFSLIGVAVGSLRFVTQSHQVLKPGSPGVKEVSTLTPNPLPPGGYLASGSTYVLFIQFTNTNNTLSGEWNQATIITNTVNNMLQVSSFQTNFSAFLNGTQFNLDESGRTLAGSYNGNNVTIEFPQQDGTLAPITLTPASIDDYNTAITNLQNTVNQDNQNAADVQATSIALSATATATADQQNRLNYDLQNIGGAISSLNTDANFNSLFGQYQNDLNQEQKDYQTEQTDAQAGCSNGNAGVVASDVGAIQSDVGTIQSDDGAFGSDKSAVSSDISNVQSFIDAIQQHWNNLGRQSPGVTQSDIDTALHKGNTAIQNAQAAIGSATSKIQGYDSTAQQILQQAKNLYNSMNC